MHVCNKHTFDDMCSVMIFIHTHFLDRDSYFLTMTWRGNVTSVTFKMYVGLIIDIHVTLFEPKYWCTLPQKLYILVKVYCFKSIYDWK